jgi:hypothetical protein
MRPVKERCRSINCYGNFKKPFQQASLQKKKKSLKVTLFTASRLILSVILIKNTLQGEAFYLGTNIIKKSEITNI